MSILTACLLVACHFSTWDSRWVAQIAIHKGRAGGGQNCIADLSPRMGDETRFDMIHWLFFLLYRCVKSVSRPLKLPLGEDGDMCEQDSGVEQTESLRTRAASARALLSYV
ncbi:hypothetical protein C7974DRAFT_400514 [Boeremia exigua]|uniref:uncharacterized protein n=1 Tax=Boeremia exigua TaxID=749465 RepID=UPI001E8E484E|nr:uncharacterized protein C7974DRAFT_400514 [Boeremia exigua]KAH6618630.1 hypothetical protein C7974DRAFT_400514 [Boeremia exigua]